MSRKRQAKKAAKKAVAEAKWKSQHGALGERALDQGRTYVTPEDVQFLIDIGIPKADLQDELLAIISGTRGLGVEDVKLCAHVAHKYEDSEPE